MNIGHATTVEIDIADERFSTHGLSISELNFLEVPTRQSLLLCASPSVFLGFSVTTPAILQVLRPYEQWRGRVIPNYHENEVFIPTEINMTDGHTTPPPLLTEYVSLWSTRQFVACYGSAVDAQCFPDESID